MVILIRLNVLKLRWNVVDIFVEEFFKLLTAPKSRDISDFKVIIKNLIVDLLMTLNVPEYPAASLLLQQ